MVLTDTSVHERIFNSVHESSAAGCLKLGFKAMGTWCQITFVPVSPASTKEFKRAVLRWVAGFEAKYSRFIPDSLIGRINAAAGQHWVEIDDDASRIFTLCEELIFITSGAFDPTALPLIQLWNWKAQPPVVPTDAAVQRARQLVGWHHVQRRPGAIFLPREGMCLDLGGVGKEYAVDSAVKLALVHGIQNVLVDFGQDVHARGNPPGKEAWHIGLEDPKKPGTCWASVGARNVAVATSGDYLRCFEVAGKRYGHIIDPRTGYPVANGCRSVAVVAPSCTVAGVLSTTAFIFGATEGLHLIETYHGAEGCILTETSQHQTRRFDAHVIPSH